MMNARDIIISILSDMDYNDGAMMRWHPSGIPTDRAFRVADRIIRELDMKEVKQ